MGMIVSSFNQNKINNKCFEAVSNSSIDTLGKPQLPVMIPIPKDNYFKKIMSLRRNSCKLS